MGKPAIMNVATESIMPVKSKDAKKTSVIYLGTSEPIAKLSPHAGIKPYPMPESSWHYEKGDKGQFFYLSDVYPAYFAFDSTTNSTHRWGIVEIDLGVLSDGNFLPYEGFLADRCRKKGKEDRGKLMSNYRKELSDHRDKWRESLEESGVVLYVDQIPVKAIRKVTVYDPFSNNYITDHVLNTVVLTSKHKETYRHNKLITRWMMAEAIEMEEWLGKDLAATSTDERTSISLALFNKYGLDIFYNAV